MNGDRNVNAAIFVCVIAIICSTVMLNVYRYNLVPHNTRVGIKMYSFHTEKKGDNYRAIVDYDVLYNAEDVPSILQVASFARESTSKDKFYCVVTDNKVLRYTILEFNLSNGNIAELYFPLEKEVWRDNLGDYSEPEWNTVSLSQSEYDKIIEQVEYISNKYEPSDEYFETSVWDGAYRSFFYKNKFYNSEKIEGYCISNHLPIEEYPNFIELEDTILDIIDKNR